MFFYIVLTPISTTYGGIYIYQCESELLAKFQLEYIELILRERESRLPWFGHVECSSGAIRTACDIQIDGRPGPGRPKLTWKKLTEKDCCEWKLTIIDTQERSTWRSGVRSAMLAPSQLPIRGPLMWMMPLHLHVNQKSDYDYDNTFRNLSMLQSTIFKVCRR